MLTCGLFGSYRRQSLRQASKPTPFTELRTMPIDSEFTGIKLERVTKICSLSSLQVCLSEVQLFTSYHFGGDDILPSVSCPVQGLLTLNIYRTNPCLELETPVGPIQLFAREAVQPSDQLGVVERLLSFIHARESLCLSASSLHLVSLLAESTHAATVLVPLLTVVRVRLSVLHSSSQSLSLQPFRLRLGSFGADLVGSYSAISCQELMCFLLPNSLSG